jgi:hypothetical protein
MMFLTAQIVMHLQRQALELCDPDSFPPRPIRVSAVILNFDDFRGGAKS